MPEQQPSFWTDEYDVHSYEVDAGGRAALHVLCRFFQESAWHHARSIKSWYEDLITHGLFWVLSRLSIKMERYPLWGEKVTVKTWASGTDRLFALRDFVLSDGKEAMIGTARSAWLVLSRKTRKPQRIEPFFEDTPDVRNLHAFEELPEKIPELLNPEKGQSFPVRYSDLDIQNHVNNAQYIEWTLDSFTTELHRTHHPSYFSINFLAECTHGDLISIFTERLADPSPAYLLKAVKEPEGREICRARVLWREKGHGLDA